MCHVRAYLIIWAQSIRSTILSLLLSQTSTVVVLALLRYTYLSTTIRYTHASLPSDRCWLEGVRAHTNTQTHTILLLRNQLWSSPEETFTRPFPSVLYFFQRQLLKHFDHTSYFLVFMVPWKKPPFIYYVNGAGIYHIYAFVYRASCSTFPHRLTGKRGSVLCRWTCRHHSQQWRKGSWVRSRPTQTCCPVNAPTGPNTWPECWRCPHWAF